MDKFLADYFFQIMGVGALVAVGLLLYIVRGNKSAKDTVDTFDNANFEPVQSDVETEVRMLVDYGNSTGAIRVLQEKMGFDPSDAKDIVSAMEHGAPIPVSADGASSAENHETDHDTEARALVAAGRLISAINLVRERKGLDLKQAKAYVERL
jgi:hypothetical protein